LGPVPSHHITSDRLSPIPPPRQKSPFPAGATSQLRGSPAWTRRNTDISNIFPYPSLLMRDACGGDPVYISIAVCHPILLHNRLSLSLSPSSFQLQFQQQHHQSTSHQSARQQSIIPLFYSPLGLSVGVGLPPAPALQSGRPLRVSCSAALDLEGGRRPLNVSASPSLSVPLPLRPSVSLQHRPSHHHFSVDPSLAKPPPGLARCTKVGGLWLEP